MYTGYLSKNILTHNWLVRSYCYSRISYNKFANVVKSAFFYVGLCMKLVFQDGLHTCERRVAATFSKPVYRNMQTLCPTKYSCQRITYSKVIIIVCMKVKMRIRIAFYHFSEEFNHLKRIKHPQSVWQHKSVYICINQRIHNLIHIFRRVFHPITPVLEIKIDTYISLCRISQRIFNIINMFFRSFMQLMCTMFQRTFSK